MEGDGPSMAWLGGVSSCGGRYVQISVRTFTTWLLVRALKLLSGKGEGGGEG
jgi:hypothetical protein